MNKIRHYFLIILLIIFFTLLVFSIFYIRPIYKQLVNTRQATYFPFISRVIKHFKTHPKAAPPILKAENNIQIPEGWTNQNIANYLAPKYSWTSKDFLSLVGSDQLKVKISKEKASSSEFLKKFSFLKNRPAEADLEGYLFPDTYRIYASSSAQNIVEKMLDNFDKKLSPQMRTDIKNQGRTIYDVIIMASIVEKEAPISYNKNSNRDAKIIAGIFWDRLKNGQALESDATLSYILNDKNSQHQGRDLEINSCYNTYKYRGLPCGPISNPGLVAIKAAIYPILSDYNYFLTPLGEKKVIYAKTYSEHLKNVYKYLR